MNGYINRGLLNPALFQTGGQPVTGGLLGQPVMVPGAAPRPMSVQGGPSMAQGILNNPEVMLNLSGGLLAAGAPSSDPGRFSTALGQTLQSTGGLLGMKQKERQQQEAMKGLLGSGSFTPQQQALLTAFPQVGAEAAVQSAFTPGKQPGMVNMMNPRTQDVKSVPEGSPDQQRLAQQGYALTGNVDMPKPDAPPNSYQEFELAKRDGFRGTFAEFLNFKGQSAAPVMRTEAPVPTGYQAVRDERGNLVRYEPVPGGPIAREADQLAAQGQMRTEQKTSQADIVNDDIRRSLSMIEAQPDLMTGLMGSALSMVPGTPSHDLAQQLMGIQANMGFDKLQAMREASPTGGALGAVSDSENKLLQSTYGSIAQSQSPEQLSYNLRRFYNVYNDVVHGRGNGPERYSLQQGQTQPQGGGETLYYNPETGEFETEAPPWAQGGMPGGSGAPN